jgi:hypothetical protein
MRFTSHPVAFDRPHRWEAKARAATPEDEGEHALATFLLFEEIAA